MTWDLIQNVMIVLIVLWILNLVGQINAGFRATAYRIKRGRK